MMSLRTCFCLWLYTETEIDWFKAIRNKHLHTFTIFDIKRILSFDHRKPAKKALTFAEAHTVLSYHDKSTIHHARKSLLFNNQQIWIKRDSGLLMSWWEISWKLFTEKNYHNYTRKRTKDCIETMFLRIKVEQNEKKIKKLLQSLF